MEEWLYILILLILLFGTFFAFHAIKTLFCFLLLIMERQLANQNQAVHEFDRLSLFILLKKYFTELYYILSKYLFLPLKYMPSIAPAHLPHAKSAAIVLVHGIGRHQGDWCFFKKNLEKNCTLPVYAVNLKPDFAAIQQIANSLKQHIDIIHHNTGIKNFILIGHSMGGLVATYFQQYLSAPYHIKQIITLGTPWHGTKIASLALTPNGSQMRPNTPFILQLRNKMDPNKTQYFHIASQFDNMIFPWDSAIIQAHPHEVLSDLTHQGLLHSLAVVSKISVLISSNAS